MNLADVDVDGVPVLYEWLRRLHWTMGAAFSPRSSNFFSIGSPICSVISSLTNICVRDVVPGVPFGTMDDSYKLS